MKRGRTAAAGVPLPVRYPGSERQHPGSAPETTRRLPGSGAAPDQRGGGDFSVNSAILATGMPSGTGSTAVWVVLAVVVLVVIAAAGGRRSTGRHGGRAHGAGHGVLTMLVIGALIGATVTGTTILRAIVTGLGSLFH